MVLIRTIQDNFNQGELGPFMLARWDNKLYEAGSLKVENWMLLPHGGIVRRAGFQNIDTIGPSGIDTGGGGGGGGGSLCMYETPGSSFFQYGFTGANVPFDPFALSEWYDPRAYIGNLAELTPDGMRPLKLGFVEGTYVTALAGGTTVVGSVVLLPASPPQYGMLSFDTGNQGWGCSIELHNLQGYCDPIFVTAGNLNGTSGGMSILWNAVDGNYLYQGVPVPTLPVGEFYTIQFQVNIFDTGILTAQTCYYLSRSTDGFYLKNDGTFVVTPTAVTDLGLGVTFPVRYTNAPLAGYSNVFPASWITVNYRDPAVFVLAHQPSLVTVKNLKVYHL